VPDFLYKILSTLPSFLNLEEGRVVLFITTMKNGIEFLERTHL